MAEKNDTELQKKIDENRELKGQILHLNGKVQGLEGQLADRLALVKRLEAEEKVWGADLAAVKKERDALKNKMGPVNKKDFVLPLVAMFGFGVIYFFRDFAFAPDVLIYNMAIVGLLILSAWLSKMAKPFVKAEVLKKIGKTPFTQIFFDDAAIKFNTVELKGPDELYSFGDGDYEFRGGPGYKRFIGPAVSNVYTLGDPDPWNLNKGKKEELEIHIAQVDRVVSCPDPDCSRHQEPFVVSFEVPVETVVSGPGARLLRENGQLNEHKGKAKALKDIEKDDEQMKKLKLGLTIVTVALAGLAYLVYTQSLQLDYVIAQNGDIAGNMKTLSAEFQRFLIAGGDVHNMPGYVNGTGKVTRLS